MKYVLLLLTILHIASLFLPFIIHTQIDANWRHTTSYTLMCETPFIWLFVLNFLMVVLATISLNKTLLIIINILVSIWSMLLFLAFSYMFVWDGQPVHATYSYGYWLNQLVLLLLLVFSFSWSASFKQLTPSRVYVRTLTIVTIIIPLSLILGIYLTIRKSVREPIMRSEFSSKNDTKYLYQQSWDYTEAYDAYVNKYFSKDIPADTLAPPQPFQLDSISITFFSEDIEITKKVVEKAHNGKIDIEALLEKHSN